MVKQLLAFLLQTLFVLFLALVESVVGVPFLFCLTALWFLRFASPLWRLASLVLWSFIGAVLFATSVSLTAGLLLGGVLFMLFGTGIMESYAMRLSLAALVCMGSLVWLSGVVWQPTVVGYGLLSVLVGVGIAYRSSVFTARKQSKFFWSGELLQ